MSPLVAARMRKDLTGAHEWCFYGWREDAAHQFFGCAYRDLGPRRTIGAAALPYFHRTSAILKLQLEKWSSVFHWVERAVAWDRHLDADAQRAQEAARRKMADRQLTEARAIQTKALERLRLFRTAESLVATAAARTKRTSDGSAILDNTNHSGK
jgi:hypothetical protein